LERFLDSLVGVLQFSGEFLECRAKKSVFVSTPPNACGWRKQAMTKTLGRVCCKWQRRGGSLPLLLEGSKSIAASERMIISATSHPYPRRV